MGNDDWSGTSERAMVVFLNGEEISEPGLRGEQISDGSFVLLLNPDDRDVEMTLPKGAYGDEWLPILDTATGEPADEEPSVVYAGGSSLVVTSRSVMVLRRA